LSQPPLNHPPFIIKKSRGYGLILLAAILFLLLIAAANPQRDNEESALSSKGNK
jgi:hypothetical protein